VGITDFDLGFQVGGNFDNGVEVNLLKIGFSAGVSGFDGGLASHDVAGGGALDLVVNLEAEIILLVGLVALSDGFTGNLQSSVLGEGGGSIVGRRSLGNSEESFILIVISDELEEILESVLGGFGVDFVNSGGLVVQVFDDGLFSCDGKSHD